jgi:two-component system, response regulator YesN
MYKVILVDDEKLIIEGLKNIIDWNEIGLEIVDTALNGKEAFEKFTENSADIIITDINMPKMTGLELIKSIRDINIETRFVILTGYDEFTYAKEAIKYGIENYILKPINEDELKETLINIVNDLDNKNKKGVEILDKNRKLLQYINGKLDREFIYTMESILNIDISNDKYKYTVASIFIDSKYRGDLCSNIRGIIEENTNVGYEILNPNEGQVVLINSWNNNKSNKDIINYYENIKNKIIKNLKVDIFIAIGEVVDKITEIDVSYTIAKELKKYLLTEGRNKCIYLDSVKNKVEKNINFKDEIDIINKLIIGKDTLSIESYIENILENEELTARNIYDFCIKILILIDQIANDLKVDKKYERDNLSSTIVDLCNEDTRDNIKAFIFREIEELVNIMNSNEERYSPVVQQIINIVDEKYYKDLSLKTLAYKYNINSSYLGQIFSKELGMSFSEYLNKTKNSKAKELILNTNMKINDISKAVGYIDASYFYRKFKKYYGVSPSTLREMKNY